MSSRCKLSLAPSPSLPLSLSLCVFLEQQHQQQSLVSAQPLHNSSHVPCSPSKCIIIPGSIILWARLQLPMHELTNASIESDRPIMLVRAHEQQIADTIRWLPRARRLDVRAFSILSRLLADGDGGGASMQRRASPQADSAGHRLASMRIRSLSMQ